MLIKFILCVQNQRARAGLRGISTTVKPGRGDSCVVSRNGSPPRSGVGSDGIVGSAKGFLRGGPAGPLITGVTSDSSCKGGGLLPLLELLEREDVVEPVGEGVRCKESPRAGTTCFICGAAPWLCPLPTAPGPQQGAGTPRSPDDDSPDERLARERLRMQQNKAKRKASNAAPPIAPPIIAPLLEDLLLTTLS